MSKNGGGSTAFVSLLTVAFIVLKLTNVIDWSWWWVLSPFWLSLVVGLIAIAAYVAYLVVTKKKQKK